MKQCLAILIILYSGISIKGQEATQDSLKINLEIGLIGIWQKGNLEQLSLMPNGQLKLRTNKWYSEISSSYNFLIIQGYSPINDFWFNGLYQHQNSKKIYPYFQSVNGFAKTYLIDGSSFNSIGLGINLIPNTPTKYFQFHLSTGYLYFKFYHESSHTALGFGTLIRAYFPISDHLNLKWELAGYYSSDDHTYGGGNNNLTLEMFVTKRIFVTLMHQFYYHNRDIDGVERYTSILQYGLKYKL
ncbi:hypothetical protein KFE94_04725 [bacterium SCSIO 12643]|nr:hypothetical protein KFE94_04725 [bacterium SCSIO 12643]